MTPQERKIFEQALKAFKEINYDQAYSTEITAIKEALAQAEQEPVAWLTDDERKALERFNETCEDGEGYDVPKPMMKRLAEIGVIHHTSRGIYGITKFGRSLLGYTTPPQRKPLTDEQILHFVDIYVGAPSMAYPLDNSDWLQFARAIEAAHGIKE